MTRRPPNSPLSPPPPLSRSEGSAPGPQLNPPLSGRSNLRRDVECQAGRRRADSKAPPTHPESQRLTGKEQRPGGTYDEFLRPFERLMRESKIGRAHV